MEIKIAIEMGLLMTGEKYYNVTAGRTILFKFRRTSVIEPRWEFYPGGQFNPTPVIFTGQDFPREYFDNLCRAAYLMYMGVDEFPDKVTIARGRKYIDWSCE